MKIELNRDTDERWIAEVPALPGVLVYGDSREEAISKVEALAFRMVADRIEHGEAVPEEFDAIFSMSA